MDADQHDFQDDNDQEDAEHNFDIAIVGLAGRFPGADNIDEYWQNLANGVESVSFFSDDELRSAGIDEATLDDPNYVKAAPVLDDPGLFDTQFFGYSPREARSIDPQHRLLLESAWQALEHAGYSAESFDGSIGVYAGSAANTYLLFSGLLPNFTNEYLPTLIGNDKDFLATRISYKMNLTGPSVTVQTACSSSLVAIHTACQSLLNEECDMALAGGVAVRVPHPSGHFYQEGSVFTPDGHCRPFDAKAQGTVFGSGVGMVVLKRLTDALDDGDTIHALIKGSAINNDGSSKVEYTAPSVNSQAEAIVEALANAEIGADSISYIEAHGTGTYLGDPIEVAALTKAFRNDTAENGFCAIGSVKSNIGHLDAAAGIAGLIKVTLALKHKQIPASLHFEEPNPQIDFANSPFFVNDTLRDWTKAADCPRRAGISSLGIGGTNAHVILEEAPEPVASGSSREAQLLVVSAKSKAALDNATTQLARHLAENPDLPLADVAYTLQTGRKVFNRRRMVVCQDRDDAIAVLGELNLKRLTSANVEAASRDLVMMFPGQGAQYPNMGLGLYQTEPVFRDSVDQCAEILEPQLNLDLRDLLYPADPSDAAAVDKLKNTLIAQPALFTIEYALAQLWMSWGIAPAILVGHSIGEYVAACIAGVFPLENALGLVATRGRLMQELPSGSMLAVSQSELTVRPYLSADLSVAAVNSPDMVVVSGSHEAVDALERKLAAADIAARRLHTSHAFHSQMMEPVLETFVQAFVGVELQPPQLPIVSTVTGTWVGENDMTDPQYWANNLRQTVRFADAAQVMLAGQANVFLEVGPGNTLSTFIRRHPEKVPETTVISAMRHPNDDVADVAHLLGTLGRLWLADIAVDWSAFYAKEERVRVSLPTYPFEREHYWFKAKKQSQSVPIAARRKNMAQWFYLPTWKRLAQSQSQLTGAADTGPEKWLVFADQTGLGARLAAHLGERGHQVTVVERGQSFVKQSDTKFRIDPADAADYQALFGALVATDQAPAKIVHLWSVSVDQMSLEAAATSGFYSLLYLAQALSGQGITTPVQVAVITNNLHDVTGGEDLNPEKATILGPSRVIPKELPNVHCVQADIVWSGTEAAAQTDRLIDQLVAELSASAVTEETRIVAFRGQHRWIQDWVEVSLENATDQGQGHLRLKKDGVYLITGGLGGLGLTIAQHLADTIQPKLVLLGRSAFPAREEWPAWLAGHPADEAVCRKIRGVQDLEAAGADVLVCSADIANLAQVRTALEQVHETFGPINGLFHTAGILADGLIESKDAAKAAEVLAPKVTGTRNLHQLLKSEPLDFVVYTSSINALSAPAGQVDYAAANAFLDVFANYQTAQGGPFSLSINWPGWQEVGLLASMEPSVWQQAALKKGISPLQGKQILDTLLGYDHPQVLVSPEPLLAQAQPEVVETVDDVDDALTSVTTATDDDREDGPKTDTEKKLAAIWSEFLGIEQIGIYDNFFEIGGSSLLATQISAQVRSVFDVPIKPRAFFDAPTISDLATHIDQVKQGNIDDQTSEVSLEDKLRLLG